MIGRQLLKRRQGVRHLDESLVVRLHRVAHHGIRRAGLQGLQRKAVAVEILPFQGHEQLALPDGTGVCIEPCALQVNLVYVFNIHTFIRRSRVKPGMRVIGP